MRALTFALVHIFINVFVDSQTLVTWQLPYSGLAASSWDTFLLISRNGYYETRCR